MPEMINVFWFRRDLRLNDNKGLSEALGSGRQVLPVFIFDPGILSKLPADDKRVGFIHKRLRELNEELLRYGSSVHVFYGSPPEVFEKLLTRYRIETVFCNRDYEPGAISRDLAVAGMLSRAGTGFRQFKDQVLFEAGEIIKPDGTPYVVFTPYSRKWLGKLNDQGIEQADSHNMLSGLVRNVDVHMPSLSEMGFTVGNDHYPEGRIPEDILTGYAAARDYPGLDRTSRLGVHLRFGTISIRDCIRTGRSLSQTWLNELIWREFFMQILAFFPGVVNGAFKPAYNAIKWSDNESHFSRWCEGTTGYPLVDAGMRELSTTGFMHNRVRMVTASFLTKHLLINWQWGEAWFAAKLLDFELSSNNGNWQWAAGTGCDAAPYFRIFNPAEQMKKFDSDAAYVKKWVPEYGTSGYPAPIVDHDEARRRCLHMYREAIRPG